MTLLGLSSIVNNPMSNPLLFKKREHQDPQHPKLPPGGQDAERNLINERKHPGGDGHEKNPHHREHNSKRKKR